eukprot:CAMPEP_0185767678 /NCGR_PEP_ID=MMETSP1174-20130828/45489_1 /TAXON_ID=35687 /ORGANISM="Dictyocha speculum, Strain CCMP1381" /LENGTH=140 /DNA_ID=CAMNT_0028452005 /DNA_START=382 /DNA_END=804 /DNA_ORIENTATION=-
MVSGQVKRMDEKIAKLEADTGYRLRVLTQSYPETPGLAIKDYWGVNDKTIVMVVDHRKNAQGVTSNILNFNVGESVEGDLPPVFFSRVRNFFGTQRYIKESGEDQAVEGAVDSIVTCLRQEEFCSDIPAEQKMKQGKAFI